MPIDVGNVVLKYFDLAGNNRLCGLGGAIRFYLITNDIKFTDVAVPLTEWQTGLKAEAIKSGESITGQLPVVIINGKPYIETTSILRLLSRKFGQYGTDAEHDYIIDMTTDVVGNFRRALSTAGVPTATSEQRHTYLTSPDQRKHFYHIFNTIISTYKGSGAHVISDEPTSADALLFATLWDDVVVFKGDEYLWVANPHVEAFFQAYLQQEGVMQWCHAVRPDITEGVRSG